ncbi:MAG: alpha/beta fold hydrolase [Ktedonobacterales bacterium]|nr:alpha/beta fold hydrolase [Ktedonobacterales bacterium]
MQFNTPHFVSVAGRKIAYEEVAPAAPQGTILLLTGLAAKRQGWHRQMAAFGEHYRTIAIDHRDVGDSDLATALYATTDQAEDAAAVLRALGVARAFVVGISMGGFIALELTLRHPEMVERLVLTATSAGGKTHVGAGPRIQAMLLMPRLGRRDAGKIAKQTYNLIMAPGYCAAHPDEWEDIAEIARHRPQSAQAYRRQLQACLKHDAAARLGQIAVPTLVIHGEVDPLIPVANGRYLAEHIPGARLILYPNTGHIPIVERAADYNQAVLAFLAEAPALV